MTQDGQIAVGRGDVNGDGRVTVADITSLMSALADLNEYESANRITYSQLVQIADLTGDGKVANVDVQGLINLLANSGGTGTLASVPEPATLVLACCAAAFPWAVRVRRGI